MAYNVENINDQAFTLARTRGDSLTSARYASFFGDLSEETRQDLFNYLHQVGLTSESSLLVIPANRHFFYDKDDLKGVRTIVNLKQLNHIREMREFLKTLFNILPSKSIFVGCFIDNKKQNGFSYSYFNSGRLSDRTEAYENGIESRIPFINRMYNFMDSRTNRYLTKKSVITSLKDCGFEVLEMTEISGMTFFSTQKIAPAA